MKSYYLLLMDDVISLVKRKGDNKRGKKSGSIIYLIKNQKVSKFINNIYDVK